MISRRFKKMLAATLSASLILGMNIVPSTSSAADKVDTSNWKSSIAIDFGTHTSECDTSTRIQDVAGYEGLTGIAGLVPGYGNMTYDKTTVANLYEDAAGASEQKIGFDRVLPAAKTTAGGNYFTDWVFSPNGEAYSFSADLPVGQYYVYVYTGNKTKDYNNTTLVNFNNEELGGKKIIYDHTSNGGSQFYGPTNTECVYVADVTDNGKGYGTLVLNLSDDTLDNEAYAGSHKLTIAAETEAETPASVDHFDFTDINMETVDTSAVITARLNGIEIVPVAAPAHAEEFLAPENMSLEMGQSASFKEALSGISPTTDRIVYTSLDPSIASIDIYSGAITANAIGETTIAAYNAYLKKSVETKLTVTEETIIKLDKASATLNLDDNGTAVGEITATVNVADAGVIEWSSSNPDVILIDKYENTGADSKATIKALKPGLATITATRTDTGKSAECAVTVTQPVKSVAIADMDGNAYADDTELTVMAGEKIQVSTIVLPENATNKNVLYKSSDYGIAEVYTSDGTATIEAIAAGEVTITVVSNENSEIIDTIKVKVTPAPTQPPKNEPSVPPSNITASPSPDVPSVSNPPKDSGVYKVTISGKATTKLKLKKKVTFKVKASGVTIKKITVKIKSGKKLVKVKKTGKKIKITALKRGTAKVTVTVKLSNGKTRKFTKTVKVK